DAATPVRGDLRGAQPVRRPDGRRRPVPPARTGLRGTAGMVVLTRRGAMRGLGVAVAPAVLPASGGAPGGGGAGGRDPLPGPSGRLDPIYDVTVAFPDAHVTLGGLDYAGVTLDLEATFDDPTVRDADPRFRAPLRVVGVTAGGMVQPFVVPQPIV